MSGETKMDNPSGLDGALVAMFLKMSPEERWRPNDDAFRTMLELRDAYRRKQAYEGMQAVRHLKT